MNFLTYTNVYFKVKIVTQQPLSPFAKPADPFTLLEFAIRKVHNICYFYDSNHISRFKGHINLQLFHARGPR